MADIKYYDVILKPVITEKSMNAMAEKKYTFLVHPEATKSQIKEAVEKMFEGTEVAKVNTMNNDGKVKRRGVTLGRTDKYKKAIVKLTEASKVLPANYKKGDKNYGRFTAGLAHTVLLKLYMLTKQWDKAEAEGRELMKPEYGFELVPEYKDIFTLANEKNPEIIWACQCAKGYQEHKWQPHVLPNDYNFTSYLDKMTKWNGYKISWDFMQTFDPADRRLLTIAYEYTSKDGVVHNEKNDRPDPSAQLYLGAVPLKYEFDPDCTGEDSQIDWIIYRYADVLTLTAEAIVRNKNAVTQEAVDLLNEVRTRSLPGKGYSLQDLNSVDKFLKAVLDERGWELYFEGNRRQDLIRYGLFVEAIKKKAQSMGKQTLVDEDRYRFPIPQDIIDEGQGIIKQNPGY